MSETTTPILWGRTETMWTPHGYRIQLVVMIDQRASHLLADELDDALREIGQQMPAGAARITSEIQPGFTEKHGGGTRAEPAFITLRVPRDLFEIVHPDTFRDLLDRAAIAARAEGDRQHQADAELLRPWRERLARQ
jgi:hypothetical protein